MRPPTCPRCESRDLVPSAELLEASDETVPATHECQRCKTRFRYIPPKEVRP